MEVSVLEKALTSIESKSRPKVEILPDTITENGALAYSTTGNPGLDLFTLAVRDTAEPILLELFRKAWDQNPEQAVAIAMNLRDARDGKGERALVWYILLWLRTYKPGTYLVNLETFVDLGYFKDLFQIVKLVHERKLDFLGQQTFVELEYFAELLKRDFVTSPDKVSLTLAAKWAPTERTQFDKRSCGKQAYILSKLCFPDSESPQRDYRKMLSTMREELKVVERLMSENRWDEINFGQVPAKAHRLLRKVFGQHQADRYKKYLEDLTTGKEKINTAGTQPHELVRHYMRGEDPDAVIEGQFSTVVSKLKKKGILSKALAIVDVSGSMAGQPMEVAIALGLVTAELTSEPFKNTVITFSSTPQLHTVSGSSLKEKVSDLRLMDWGMNTNLLAVFDLILDRATSTSLAPERMIETLFIFTDMQFDAAESGDWNTTYGHIQSKYSDQGYTAPNIVFWNLRSSHVALPVTEDTPGVALVSGFSAELLKIFIEGGEFTPEEMMKRAISPYLEKVRIHSADI